jgi:MFS family permease
VASRSARLPRTVWVLGLTSLFTDMSSEMIVPLLPLYLATVLGAGPAFLGAIEGAAETTASLLKLVSGLWSDRLLRRKPLVVFGYTLSSLARPVVALATSPWHVLAIRVADRVGKGLRTSPRDAVVADVTAPEVRGRAYGFHRSMDHAGAVVGPLLAMAIMAFVGGRGRGLRIVFGAAAVPAVLAVAVLVFGLVEPQRKEQEARAPAARVALGGRFWRYLATVLLFTLGNSSDAFLLLRASQVGIRTIHIPLLWVALHVVKSSLSTPCGILSDKMGRRRTIAVGWLLYAVSYALFAAVDSARGLLLVFGLYGVYFALTEGAEKALVAALVPDEARGRAFGYFHATVGIGALPASLLFGVLWQHWGAAVAFGTGAALALAACLGLGLSISERAPAPR